MKKIKIPVTWVEYKKGELVVEVPDNVEVDEIIKKVEEQGIDNVAFCDFEYPATLTADEDAEYGEYAIADKNNITVENK